MTAIEQVNIVEDFIKVMKEVILKKRADYAADEDVLSNFKEVAVVVGITPEQVALVHMATKLLRLKKLAKSSHVAANEPFEDSCLDLANYSLLLKCIHVEK